MTTIQFQIDDNDLLRLSNAMDNDPEHQFVFVQGEGTIAQQKRKFFRQKTKEFWRSFVFNAERTVAIANEPNDTAAEQAKRFTDLNIIDSEI